MIRTCRSRRDVSAAAQYWAVVVVIVVSATFPASQNDVLSVHAASEILSWIPSTQKHESNIKIRTPSMESLWNASEMLTLILYPRDVLNIR